MQPMVKHSITGDCNDYNLLIDTNQASSEKGYAYSSLAWGGCAMPS
jgi:hypothetical protein